MTNVRPEFLYTHPACICNFTKSICFSKQPGIRVKAGSAFETEIVVDISAKELAKQSQSQNRSRKKRSRADSPPADELSLDLPTYKKNQTQPYIQVDLSLPTKYPLCFWNLPYSSPLPKRISRSQEFVD